MNSSKILIVGLGSMGKRRIRCLKYLDSAKTIFGYDTNLIRQKAVCEDYNINPFNDFDNIGKFNLSCIIISTSPESHHIYLDIAIKNNLHAFIEAGLENKFHDYYHKSAINKNLIIAPSCTLIFHPAIKKIKEIYNNNSLGKFLNMTYCSGQYLPDWHPYEKVSDFYVSKKNTGGAREIVPFELTWIIDIFGYPKGVFSNIKKTMSIDGADEIDDTYFLMLDYETSIINLNVDVVSRKATRILILNFEKGQLIWNWENNFISQYDAINQVENKFNYETLNFKGYNKNISELMYIEELKSFFSCISNKNIFFPNNIKKDKKIINILLSAENSNISGNKTDLIV